MQQAHPKKIYHVVVVEVVVVVVEVVVVVVVVVGGIEIEVMIEVIVIVMIVVVAVVVAAFVVMIGNNFSLLTGSISFTVTSDFLCSIIKPFSSLCHLTIIIPMYQFSPYSCPQTFL